MSSKRAFQNSFTKNRKKISLLNSCAHASQVKMIKSRCSLAEILDFLQMLILPRLYDSIVQGGLTEALDENYFFLMYNII